MIAMFNSLTHVIISFNQWILFVIVLMDDPLANFHIAIETMARGYDPSRSTRKKKISHDIW